MSEALFGAAELQAKIERLGLEIFENHTADEVLYLVGIHSRGVPLARRVARHLAARGVNVEMGTVDISLYRDDLAEIAKVPKLVGSEIGFEVDGAKIVLFDDVLFTGRTVKAAIDVLTDYGRPGRIELAVLLDRGCRELPIQADYLGEFIEADEEELVDVKLTEVDGEDGVYLTRRG